MRKPGVLILTILLSLGACYVNYSLAVPPQGDSDARDIGDVLEGYLAQLKGLEKTMTKNADLAELTRKFERIRRELTAYCNLTIKDIQKDVLLKGTYNNCLDECTKLDDAIRKIKSERMTDSLSVKLVNYDSVFQKMKRHGIAFMKDGDKERLDSVKTEVTGLWGQATVELNAPENKKLIEDNPALKQLLGEVEKTKKSIESMKVEDGTKILDYVWKIALPIALALLVINIVVSNYKSWKSKKLLTRNNKKKQLPSI
jgi:hypothetical protein